jgi:hypothetical protein
LERDHSVNEKREDGIILKSDLEERDFNLLSGVELAQLIRSHDFFVVFHKNNCIFDHQSIVPLLEEMGVW